MSDADQPAGGGEGLPRLPPGRHGLPRSFVVENQRQRLAAGAISVVAEDGYHAATVSAIAAAAGVSRRTFYGYFSSKAECFFDTYEMVAEFLLEAMAEAGAGERRWPARVRAELAALLGVYAANPDLARFTLLAPRAAGGEVDERYRRFLEQLLAELGEGRPRNRRQPSAAAELGLMGGLAALIADRVAAGQGESLDEPASRPDRARPRALPGLRAGAARSPSRVTRRRGRRPSPDRR